MNISIVLQYQNLLVDFDIAIQKSSHMLLVEEKLEWRWTRD
jgi:hypothetical protein